MSEDPKNPPRDPADPIQRYQRRGGSARKDEPVRGGLWQRVRDWVGTDSKTGGKDVPDVVRVAPREEDPQASDVGEPVEESERPVTATAGKPERLAVELVLPGGQRLVLLVTAPHGRGGGLLQLQVESAPANDPRIVRALAAVAHGAAEEEPPTAPEPARTREPSRPTPPVAATPEPEAPEPAADLTPPVTRPRLPTGPSLPASARDTAPGVDTRPSQEIDLPPAVARTAAGARDTHPGQTLPLGLDAPTSAPVEAPQPAAEESPRRRLRPAAARGGAAGVMFGDAPEPEEPPRAAPAPKAAPRPEPPRPEPRKEPEPPRPEPRREPEPPRPEPAAAAPSFLKDERTPAVAPLFPEDEPTTSRASPAKVEVQAQDPYVDHLGPAPRADDDEQAYRPAMRSSQLPIVGIDFGTSYSSIALMRAGLEVIPDENGDILLPSVISFPNPGQTLIGWDARNRMGGEGQFTIVSPKRLLGRLYKDPQVAQLLGGLAFRTFAGTDKFVRFEAHGEIYTVTDICAMILGRLRERACRYLDAEVSKAVFTVPVGFGTLQRSALEVAARKAGLEPVGLLTEPSAAVLAHGFRSQRGVVAVYDFGGGTFDFSILEVSETAFQVLCAGGDPWLGGDDFDNVIASALADRFWKETGVDLRNRAVEWQALIFACEQAKRILSSKSAAEVRVDNLLHTAKGSKGLRYKVTRKEFVALAKPLIEKSISIAEKVMGQAGISPRQVDAVTLTGGTSMIPAVREAVSKYFGRKPIEGDPDLAVVRGASLRAAELKGEAVAETSMGGRTLREVAGRTIGAGPKGGQVVTLFERDTPLPAEVFKAFYTQFDNQTEMVIGLYEESKSRVDESRTIGHLRYKGLRPAPAGQSRIDFTFFLDEDGILHVTALVEGKEYTKSIRLQ